VVKVLIPARNRSEVSTGAVRKIKEWRWARAGIESNTLPFSRVERILAAKAQKVSLGKYRSTRGIDIA
jgi:hypothetical protein